MNKDHHGDTVTRYCKPPSDPTCHAAAPTDASPLRAGPPAPPGTHGARPATVEPPPFAAPVPSTLTIPEWPPDQRPRERLIRLGPAALSDAELLAIFLRMGVPGKTAVDLARDTLDRFGSLEALFGASLAQFSQAYGLGPAKYAQLQAVFELARRVIGEAFKGGIELSASGAVSQYLQLCFAGKTYESFLVLFLDVGNRLLCAEELFRGTLTRATVHPREVVKAALAHNAAGVILAHNHPSGDPTPSAADMALTQTLKAALDLVEVRVLDHFVVAGTGCYSFAEHGYLQCSAAEHQIVKCR